VTIQTIPTDTPPDLAGTIAGLSQQVNELCAALSDIHSTACIALCDQMNDGQRRLWVYIRALADDAISTARQQPRPQAGD